VVPPELAGAAHDALLDALHALHLSDDAIAVEMDVANAAAKGLLSLDAQLVVVAKRHGIDVRTILTPARGKTGAEVSTVTTTTHHQILSLEMLDPSTESRVVRIIAGNGNEWIEDAPFNHIRVVYKDYVDDYYPTHILCVRRARV
jgi:hypothetical protein